MFVPFTPARESTQSRALRLPFLLLVGLLTTLAPTAPAGAQASPQRTLFTNVNVFDGVNEALITDANVLVEGNLIRTVSTSPIQAAGATVIDGGGRTLMPGLIDAHFHIAYSQLSVPELYAGDIGHFTIKAVLGAERALMRGFTTIRDMGGGPFSVKNAVDQGLIPGPRLYLSGAPISQTSGHFDARDVNAVPSNPGAELDYWNRNRDLYSAAVEVGKTG